MFQLTKNGTLFELFRLSLSFLFSCVVINRVNLAFRTTIIEDTHLTLAFISFKVEANNSLIFLPLQTYEKKFAEFPFLLVYHSLNILSTRKAVFPSMDKAIFRLDNSKAIISVNRLLTLLINTEWLLFVKVEMLSKRYIVLYKANHKLRLKELD